MPGLLREVRVDRDEVRLLAGVLRAPRAGRRSRLRRRRGAGTRRRRSRPSRSPSRAAPPPARSGRSPRCRSSCGARPGPASSAAPRSTAAPRAGTARPRPTRRAAAISSANAVSAVVSVSTSGVLVASTPAAVHAATSMLSKPTAWFATIFSCGPAAARNSASTCSVSIVINASRPATTSRSSSRGMPNSFSWMVDVAAFAQARERLVHDRAGHQHVRAFAHEEDPSVRVESPQYGPNRRGSGNPRAMTAASRLVRRMSPPTLETERLRLRPYAADGSDLDALQAVLGDPVSMRWYPAPFDRRRHALDGSTASSSGT